MKEDWRGLLVREINEMRLITYILSHGKYKSNLCEDGIQDS